MEGITDGNQKSGQTHGFNLTSKMEEFHSPVTVSEVMIVVLSIVGQLNVLVTIVHGNKFKNGLYSPSKKAYPLYSSDCPCVLADRTSLRHSRN